MKYLAVAVLVSLAGTVSAVEVDVAPSKAQIAALSRAARENVQPNAPTPSAYELDWQRRLLAFEMAYAATLTSPAQEIDATETGSITSGR